MNLAPEQYDLILTRINQVGIRPIIVAGQAVNIWGTVYREWDAQHNPHSPKIGDLLPLTSEDMELLDTGIVGLLSSLQEVTFVDRAEPFQKAHSPDNRPGRDDTRRSHEKCGQQEIV